MASFVMYGGQVVEEAETATIITAPSHPYTRALLEALPQAGRRGPLRSIPGAPPSLIDTPAGCRFAPRCPLAMQQCTSWVTELVQAEGAGHRARCWRHHEVGRVTACQASDSV